MEKTHKDGDKLSADEEQYIKKTAGEGNALCPDCISGVLRAGPTGGLSVNCTCDNETCGSRFNLFFPFFIERISNASPKKKTTRKEGPYR